MALKHEALTGHIIKAFYKVYNELGYGFLEKVYENALALELASTGLRVGRQQPIKVYYLGRQVGDYYADLTSRTSLSLNSNVQRLSAKRMTRNYSTI